MAKQLVFDLPIRTSMTRGDFFVSEANAAAIGLMDQPQSWPNGRLIIVGPKGAGKSHLANVWHHETGAEVLQAETLEGEDIAARGTAPALIVEDIDRLPGPAEENAFHLLNLMLSGGGRILMTSRAAPTALDVNLPDLASRLQGSGVGHLDSPDDALLSQLVLKLFADRQINPEPALIPWLVARLERSFEAVELAVEKLDTTALSKGQNVTRALARSVLGL